MIPGPSYPFVDQILQRQLTVKTNPHTDFQKHDDNASILANGSMTLGCHAGINKNLRNGAAGCFRFFALIGPRHRAYKVRRMKERNVLKTVRNAATQIFRCDDSHSSHLTGPTRKRVSE